MRGENGYFRLVTKGDDVYIRLYPPESGGEMVGMEELSAYLERNHIVSYQKMDLKRAIERKEETELFLVTFKLAPVDEQIKIQISDDKMLVTARFYPACAGGNLLSQNDIITLLAHNGIVAGIQKEQIEAFLQERAYCTDYIMAKGRKPIEGKHASITYYFNLNKDIKPALKEDGSVDFHELNNISHVKKGDLLAKLNKEVEGKPGKTVTGTLIPPAAVKREKLRYGRNIAISEDHLCLISQVDGHAELVDDKVFVSDVLNVAADVDVSTGDIEFEGSIEVPGNVRSGFRLKAKGDIIVGGVVEAATLIAGKDIVLKRGIQGMGKGYLEAQNNIIAKFIENAKVKSEGSITTEAVLHSHVSAKKEVIITGKKGFVTGGSVAATYLVKAKTIGSDMGASTIISVGSDPDKKDLFYNLQTETGNIQKNLEQLKPMAVKAAKVLSSGKIADLKQKQQLRKIIQLYQQLSEQTDKNYKEMKSLEGYLDSGNSARIQVSDMVYPGAKIIISECSYVVKDIQQHCQFRKENGEVHMVPL